MVHELGDVAVEYIEIEVEQFLAFFDHRSVSFGSEVRVLSLACDQLNYLGLLRVRTTEIFEDAHSVPAIQVEELAGVGGVREDDYVDGVFVVDLVESDAEEALVGGGELFHVGER